MSMKPISCVCSKVSQEYKAVYQYGRINYGTFPYTTAEFDEKLNKLL